MNESVGRGIICLITDKHGNEYHFKIAGDFVLGLHLRNKASLLSGANYFRNVDNQYNQCVSFILHLI